MASIWPSSWSADSLSLVRSNRSGCVASVSMSFKQKFAVPFYSVERRAQVMTQTAIEGFERFVFLTIGRRILDEAFHECVQLQIRVRTA